MADASAFFDNVINGTTSSQLEEVEGFSEGADAGVGRDNVFQSIPVEQTNGEAKVPSEATQEIPVEVEYKVPTGDNPASDTDDDVEDSDEIVFDGRKAAMENSRSEAEIAKVKKEAQVEINNMNNMINSNSSKNEKREIVQETVGKADKTLENALAAAKDFEMYVNQVAQEKSPEGNSTEINEFVAEGASLPAEELSDLAETPKQIQNGKLYEVEEISPQPTANEPSWGNPEDIGQGDTNITNSDFLAEEEDNVVPSQELEDIDNKIELLDPASKTVASVAFTNDASSLFDGPSETDSSAFKPGDQEIKPIDNLTIRASSSTENLSSSSTSHSPVVRDASSLFASADSLFGSPPADSGGFDSVVGAAASSAFSAAPINNFDPFSSPPPDNASLFNAPPPGALPAGNLPPKNVAPADLFNFAAPVHVPVPTNPMAPPSAPGVRVPVVSPTPARANTPPASANVSMKQNSPARPNKPAIQAPPGAIPTPHGFVVQSAPKQPQFQQPETKIPQAPLSGTAPLEIKLMSNPAPAPISTQSSATLYANNSHQPQQEEINTTAVQAPSSNTIPTPYGMASSQAMPTPYGFSAPPTKNDGNIPAPLPTSFQNQNAGLSGTVPSSSSTGNNRKNTKYSRPTTFFATFGFGGKLVVYNAGTGLMKNTALKVCNTLQTVVKTNNDSNACYKFGNEHIIGSKVFCSLLTNFPKLSSTNLAEECSKFIDERMMQPLSSNVSSEKLLLQLIKLLVSTGGSVNSELGCEDPSSPEAQIIQLLLGQTANKPLTSNALWSSASQEAYRNHNGEINDSSGIKKAEMFSNVEAFLLCGSRDEAATLAAERGEWGLALLIGSLCSPEKYKEIAVQYSNRTFPLNSSLNVITKLFSNQTDSMALSGANVGSNEVLSFESTWKRNTASVVANKSTEWSSHLISIGDRLKDPNQLNDVMAAHFVYLTGGLLPTAPGKHTKFSLIGYNFAGSKVNTLVNVQALLAFRMTELVEMIMINCMNKSGSKKGESSSTLAKSLSGMFGLGGSSASTQASQTDSASGEASLSGNNKIVPLSDKQIQEFRVAFAPMKLRFAMLLADFGNNLESYEYAMNIKEFIATTEEVHAASQRAQLQKERRGSGKVDEKKMNKLFSSKFARAVDEFYDRIGKTLPDDSKNNIKSASGTVVKSSSGSSIWDFTGSVLSAAVGGANLKDFVDGPQTNENASKPPLVPSPKPQAPAPMPSPTTQYNASFQQPPQQTQGPGGYAYGIQPGNAPGVDINLLAAPSFPDTSGIGGKISNVNDVAAASKKTGEGNGRTSPGTSSNLAQSSSNSGPGVISNVRKSLLGWMYPDAKDANDNLGTENKAYFDEATKKWVFPGEDPVDDIAAGPPPTSFGSGPGGPLTTSSSATGGDAGGYDPLAAMMAPPSRGHSYAQAQNNSTSGAYDPLAAMMAPPSRSMSMGASPTMSTSPAVGGAPPQMWIPSPQPTNQQAPAVFEPEKYGQGFQRNGIPPQNNLGGDS